MLSTPASPQLWTRRFYLLLLSVSLLRLLYLFIVPLDLGPDESYYWDWSRRLDLGYYSKPPMIAWVNALSTGLFGISAVAVRLPAVLLGALGLWGLFLCARRMFSAEVGFWAVAAWLATPGTAALGLIMATDVLLVCCWSLALYALWRSLEEPAWNLRWWLLCMLLVGLGTLSKQMMMLFPLLIFGYLLTSPEDRAQLKRPWPYLLWGGSLLFLLPPVWWNSQNDWITFQHTAHHIEIRETGLLDHIATFFEFVGSQMGLLTPVTWLLLIGLGLCLLFGFRRQPRQVRLLLCFSLAGLLVFFAMSFKQSINPNWPATFYPAGMILLAAWACRQLAGQPLARWQRFFFPGLKLGLALTAVAYLLPFVMQTQLLELGKKDPTYRIKGWQQMGRQVADVLKEQPRPEQTFILSPLRKYPAEMAFYMPGHPKTYRWPGNPRAVSSQYELWPGPDKIGGDALILNNAGAPLARDLIEAFERIVPLGEKQIPTGSGMVRSYSLYRGEGLRYWPE